MPPRKTTKSSLDRYHAKRDFSKTQEPKGGAVRKGHDPVLRYLIQKHQASHLHYDFRLELDGTLKSWPSPKGAVSILPTNGWPYMSRIIPSNTAASKGPSRKVSMAAAR